MYLTTKVRNGRRRARAIEAKLNVARKVVLGRGCGRRTGNTERGDRGNIELNLAERARGRDNRLAHVTKNTRTNR